MPATPEEFLNVQAVKGLENLASRVSRLEENQYFTNTDLNPIRLTNVFGVSSQIDMNASNWLTLSNEATSNGNVIIKSATTNAQFRVENLSLVMDNQRFIYWRAAPPSGWYTYAFMETTNQFKLLNLEPGGEVTIGFRTDASVFRTLTLKEKDTTEQMALDCPTTWWVRATSGADLYIDAGGKLFLQSLGDGSFTSTGTIDIETIGGVAHDLSITSNRDLILHAGESAILEASGSHNMEITAVQGDILISGDTTYCDVVVTTHSFKTDTTQVILLNLPTSAPGTTGQLWNDSGTVKIA